MSWSPFSAAVMADPANGHHELLGTCPVHRCGEFDPPFYTLSLYADVEEALRDIETFSYDLDAPYAPEAWRGRVRASGGVGGVLSEPEVAAFDRELESLLVVST